MQSNRRRSALLQVSIGAIALALLAGITAFLVLRPWHHARGSTRLITVLESIQENAGGRQIVKNRQYARIIAQLSAAPPACRDEIPPFNPFRLIAQDYSALPMSSAAPPPAAPLKACPNSGPTSSADGVTSLYESLYLTARAHGISPERIQQIVGIHASHIDFRRRVETDDTVDFLFEIDDKDSDRRQGELLYSAISAGDDPRAYYWFHVSNGVVGYYDAQGRSAQWSIKQRPLLGEDVRLIASFGMRQHPVQDVVRMHSGVDWATAAGTPVVAAAHGIIEEAGVEGGYGNYIRIRHANGYKTAYGHLRNIASEIRAGKIVRRGDVIGFVGNTGVAMDPHLHFEVLINGMYIDPMKLSLPLENELTGTRLQEFQRQRDRVDRLMHWSGK